MIFKEYNSKERDSSYGTGRNILWNNSQSSVIQKVGSQERHHTANRSQVDKKFKTFINEGK